MTTHARLSALKSASPPAVSCTPADPFNRPGSRRKTNSSGSSTPPIQRRILIIAKRNFTIDGMMNLLSTRPGNGLITCVEPGTHACHERFRMARPDILLVHEAVLGDSVEDFIEGMLLMHPQVRMVIFGSLEVTTRLRVIRAGAHGYLGEEANADHLNRALDVVAGGGLWVERSVLEQFLRGQDDLERHIHEQIAARTRSLRDSLSPRETQILAQVMHGHPLKEIAATCHLSQQGVKVHLTKLFARYGVHSRCQLVLAVYQQVSPGCGLMDKLFDALSSNAQP